MRRLPALLALSVVFCGCAAGGGQQSQRLVDPTQVQKAFIRAGLQTRIVFDCFAERHSAKIKTVCPAEAAADAQGAPNVFGIVADERHTISKTNIQSPLEAWVLGSTHAANGFNRIAIFPSVTSTTPLFVRLQLRNVVVQALRRGDYARKAQAALAALAALG